MTSRRQPDRSPRKTPIQARSQSTWVAILEATIQVLLGAGLAGLTTTRIAERAGVSVGTLYQYFPNKQALLLTVFERHVDAVANTVEDACRLAAGMPLDRMMAAVCAAFIGAKVKRRDIALALQHVTSELGGDRILRERAERTGRAMAAMLLTSPDMEPAAIPQSIAVLVPAIVGVVDAALAAGADGAALRVVEHELTVLAVSYLRAGTHGRRTGSHATTPG